MGDFNSYTLQPLKQILNDNNALHTQKFEWSSAFFLNFEFIY